MLTQNDIKKAGEFNNSAQETGGYLDTTFTTPSYRIRDMYKWARDNEKDVEKLSTDERDHFLVSSKKRAL